MTKTWVQIQNEPIKAMRKLDLQLAASRRIRDDNGLTFFSVTGNQQGGKSTYCMLVLWEIYEHDVDEVMRHIVMDARDFADIILKAIDGGYRERAILWDDMSVSGSAASWMTDPKFVKALGGLGDTLGVATKCLMLSSPSGDMIKAFREYQKYKVMISPGNGKFGRVARGYWLGKSPMDQVNCSLEFEDMYDVRLPFYERYAQKRKDISLKAATEMMKMTQQIENETAADISEESWIERSVISQYEKGISNLTKIAHIVNDALDVNIGHQKVGRILKEKGLRVI